MSLTVEVRGDDGSTTVVPRAVYEGLQSDRERVERLLALRSPLLSIFSTRESLDVMLDLMEAQFDRKAMD